MKRLVILGAGTAGTMIANRMRRRLSPSWSVQVIDPASDHLYQPGLLFLPFGARDERKMLRARERTLSPRVEWVRERVEVVDTAAKRVDLQGGVHLPYDYLVIATGSRIRPEETPGLVDAGWRRDIFDFYTLDGAQSLREAIARFRGGRLVLNVVEMPIKCPVAPLEFLFLADDHFRRRGIRDRVELVYATPLDGVFTKPIANRLLGHLVAERGIRVETEFSASEVDPDARTLRSYDERAVPYDLLVTIPTHGGAPFLESSGLGNELGFVPTHPRTLQSKAHPDVFVLGDATDLPSSKAGSVAHFQSEVLETNLTRAIGGQEPEDGFDGHANCFVETGSGRALLIDFNYDVEPLPGTYPLPRLGPLRLLSETRINHAAKLAFRWLYWNALLPGRTLPVSSRLSMAGKCYPEANAPAKKEGGSHVAA